MHKIILCHHLYVYDELFNAITVICFKISVSISLHTIHTYMNMKNKKLLLMKSVLFSYLFNEKTELHVYMINETHVYYLR